MISLSLSPLWTYGTWEGCWATPTARCKHLLRNRWQNSPDFLMISIYLTWHWHVVHSADMILRTAAIKRHRSLWQSQLFMDILTVDPSLQLSVYSEDLRWSEALGNSSLDNITHIVMQYGPTTHCETHTVEEEEIMRKMLKSLVFFRTAFKQLMVIAE